MLEAFTSVVPVITALGLGGIAGAIVQYVVERRKQVQAQHFDFKRQRYGAILILMITRTGSREDMLKLTARRPDLADVEDLIRELDTELLNAFLFASDPVIEALAAFNQEPSRRRLLAVAGTMRRDLYGRAHNIDPDTIESICSGGPLGDREFFPASVAQRQSA